MELKNVNPNDDITIVSNLIYILPKNCENWIEKESSVFYGLYCPQKKTSL